ncbi:unnamed protein product, partial [Hymenolepis diminuta]
TVINSHSKGFDITLLSSTTSRSAISILNKLFLTPSVPETLVTDLSTQFRSTLCQILFQSIH